MHVPDGFLSPVLTLPAWAAAAPLWAVGVRRTFGAAAAERLPTLGALTALAFVLQSLMVPLPGGTSVHLVGTGLLAILTNPLAAFACESLVLLLQTLLLGSGGLTVLPVNALAIGLVGPTGAWLVWHALRRVRRRPAAFLAGWLALQLSTLTVAAVLGVQHALDPAYFPLPFSAVVGATLVPALTVTGVVEGLYTAVVLSLLSKVDPHGLPGTRP